MKKPKTFKRGWYVHLKITDSVYGDKGLLYNQKEIIDELKSAFFTNMVKVKVLKIKKGE